MLWRIFGGAEICRIGYRNRIKDISFPGYPPPEKDDGICEATWQNVVKARLTRRLNSPMLIFLSHKQAVTSLSSSFLAAKKVVFQAGPARRPYGLVAREKIFLTLTRERIFSRQALPETAEKQTEKKHKK